MNLLNRFVPVSGPSINKPLKSQEGGTCVHAAARRGHAGALHALHALHAAGADLDARDNLMRTPLMAAVVGKDDTITGMSLLERGLNVLCI